MPGRRARRNMTVFWIFGIIPHSFYWSTAPRPSLGDAAARKIDLEGDEMNSAHDTEGLLGGCGRPGCLECGISTIPSPWKGEMSEVTASDRVKLCVGCRWSDDVLVKGWRRRAQEAFHGIDLEREAQEYLCSHPEVVLVNPVNGAETMGYCIRERQDGGKCGLGGKHWAPREVR
jgi:hypothetical protein